MPGNPKVKKNTDEKLQDASQRIHQLAESFKERPETILELMKFSTKFPKYSVKNKMLIYAQNPHAVYLQSYVDWKKTFPVKKGEKGLEIFTPVLTTYLQDEDGTRVQLAKASKELREKYKKGQIEGVQHLSFRIGHVFDISQTTCPPEEYPKFFDMGYNQEEHKKLYEALCEYSKEELGISVETKDVKSIALRGAYYPAFDDPTKRKIVISDKLKDTEKLSTLSHEIGHSWTIKENLKKTSAEMELEADVASAMLHYDFGLEVTETRARHLSSQFKSVISEKKELAKENGVDPGDYIEETIKNVFSTYQNEKTSLDPYIQKHLEKDLQISKDWKKNNQVDVDK